MLPGKGNGFDASRDDPKDDKGGTFIPLAMETWLGKSSTLYFKPS